MQPSTFLPRPATVLLAGLAGGLAEILWVAAYAGMSPASGVAVARGVTETVLPGAGDFGFAALAGVAIHMLLSVALAWAFAVPLLRRVAARFGDGALVPAALAALAGVWAFNFLVLLPALNPAFVALLPAAVSLASKLLFGAAMVAVLKRGTRAPGT